MKLLKISLILAFVLFANKAQAFYCTDAVFACNAKISSSAAAAGAPGWYGGDWTHRKTITVDNRKVASTTGLTSFPMLFSVTDVTLKSTGNGGKVGQTDGGDFVFTSNNGSTKLSHEIEKYDATTGQLVAWINVPFLSSTTTTRMFLYFGNATAADQWDTSNVWDSNFRGVYHGSDLTDSKNSRTLIGTNGTAAGKIGTTLTFDGSQYVSNTSYNTDNDGDVTIEAWVRPSATWTSVSGQRRIAGITSNSEVSGTLLAYDKQNGALSFEYYVSGVGFDAASYTMNMMSDTWYHVVGTFNDSANSQILYLNGVQVGTDTRSDSINYVTDHLYVAASFSGANLADAYIEEVRISSGVRSPEWIATEYNNQSNPSLFFGYGSLENYNGRVNKSGFTIPAIKLRGGVKFR